MVARLGNILYWACTGIAVIFLGFAFFVYFSRDVSVPFPYVWYALRPEYLPYTRGELILSATALLTYLFGRALRYILAVTERHNFFNVIGIVGRIVFYASVILWVLSMSNETGSRP